MATIKLVILPHAVLKDGAHKIRIAINHHRETRYIPTRYKVDSLTQFRDGQVINRPDAHTLNIKLRNLLNDYEERLYNISSLHLYSCTQLKELLHNGANTDRPLTFQSVANEYISELKQDKRDNYATLLERNCRYFTTFCKGDILLASITPYIIQNYVRYLKKNYRMNDTTIDMFISRTRTIINRAKRQNLVHYDVDPISIRTPVIPNVNDSEEAIESICRFIRQLPNQPAYELLGFHSLGFVKFENLGMKNPLSNSAFLKKGQLQKLKEILIRYNLNNNKK